MNSFEELDEFTDSSLKITKQLDRLRKEKNEAQEEITRLREESEFMIMAEATTGESIDKVRLNAITKEIKKHENEIKQLDMRTSVIEKNKSEVLKGMLSELNEGYQRKMNVLQKEVESKIKGVEPVANVYLKYLADLGKLNREAESIHDGFIEATKTVTDKYEKIHQFGYEWPSLRYELFGSSVEGTRGRGITEKEQLAAVDRGIIRKIEE